ncbi:MAG: ROK family protein [Chitinophagaceae bacterium]
MARNLLIPQPDNTNVLHRTEVYHANILRCLGKSKFPMTLPQIAEAIKISIPTCTKLIKELTKKRLVSKMGKKSTENGRRPGTYTLNKEKFFAIGVEILSKFIHVSVVGLDFQTVHEKVNRDFILEDTDLCLRFIISFISNTIRSSKIHKDCIIGVGIGIIENIAGKIGKPMTFFQNKTIPIKDQIENALELPVLIDNDTRVIAIAEQVLGLAKGVENVIVVKVSRTLGMGIIINGLIITGSAGLSGNISHTQFGKSSRLCYCGKKGCLGTAIGGDALLLDFKEALENNQQSIHFTADKLETYRYHDILDAASLGDELSISLIQQQGFKLGEALGNVLNIFNPELLIIDGEYLMLDQLFIDAVKNGLRKTTLVNILQCCEVKGSTLGRYLSSKAGAAMLFKQYDLVGA